MRNITVGSLFAGIGGFDLGFERAGMSTVWQVEIDDEARSVLASHFPNAKQHADVRQVGAANLAQVDVICGGFPCQDLSVAGKRAGLAGKRSGLFYEMTRIVDELRPRFLVWENVPGLLSSNGGLDFYAVLSELGRIGYHGAWTGLDSRFFGVAQRRRRIFGVFARGDIGPGPCAEILSLAARMRGDFETSGAPRQGIAANAEDDAGISRIAGSLGSNTTGGHRADLDSVGAYIPTTSPTVSAKWSKGTGGPAGDEVQNLVAAFTQNTRDEVRYIGGDGSYAGALGAQTGAKQQTYVAATLTTGVASKPGVNRPGRRREDDENLVASALTNDPTAGHNGNVNNLLASALTASMGHHGHSSPQGDGSDNLLAWESRFARNGRGAPDSVVPPLKAQSGQTGKGDAAPLVGVRRLMPIECERLQGFPDDWTRYGADGKEMSDSARYRMCGNAVTVPVAEWIGQKLVRSM